MAIEFDSAIESGNGVGFEPAGDGVYTFRLRPDTNSDDRQWFHFRISGAMGSALTLRLEGTTDCNVPSHFAFARPVVSHDGGTTWHHVGGDCTHDPAAGTFTFSVAPRSDDCRVALAVPYTHSDVQRAIRRWTQHPFVRHAVVGASIEGRDIDYLRLDPPEVAGSPRQPSVWLTARQHAGETPASFTFEGLADFLVSDDPRAAGLRERVPLHILPMLNPDGVVAGNYRDNAAGTNLNRTWKSPDPATAPEIHAVHALMERWEDSGGSVDFFIDFHSDSFAREHYAFHAAPGADPPRYPAPEEYHADSARFLRLVAAQARLFLPGKGASYSEDEGISYHYIRNRFGCLAFIPESGYSFVSHGPMAGKLMTPDDHRAVGRAFGLALAHHFSPD